MTAPTEETQAPDLLYSQAEDDLRAAVRSLLADRCDAPAVLARIESDAPYDQRLWKALAAGIGAAGLLVPEELGGQGAGHREAAVVLEELGRAVAPAPYLTSAVVATEILLALGALDGPVTELLRDLATGRKVAVLAVPFSALSPGAAQPAGVVADALEGTMTGVADAPAADVLLVPTTDGLYAVETGAEGVTVEPLVPLDLTRPLATVTLAKAPGTRLANGASAVFAVRRGLLAGAGLLASEQLGLAEWCLTETVRHTRERHQFNRPVGSFQALKHRMAQLWLEVVSARAAARNAADALATGSRDTPLAVAVAQAYCSKVAVHAAEECIQLHGGIGMTWEHPAHLYLKRAKADSIAYGTAGNHREVIAELVDLPAP
ncbi:MULTISPECIES: acyl-CoA dehydrogenase family protein [unclassified Streptomyces]|uniref:acyl-CoA dehydrogenase family protein n=1 Tax=unclassified Streptomyces TaxID=2593676 RepID=UPI00224DFD18|nr:MULTISPECIES: acyl-CoA dehydrogenase family protein [unclassified Streptomyces]WSP59467.1 acyl-CoA/acyl-ACP dehydrogenase [Streptomyces sp. NBC_01241]WSU20014.1 acyl-CoA/acyl-ACP dehydrogenase [Streptomyces sp. NBC_01108]MCX4791238.1 acyl-CoA/acyl-ACP dehydrogenase [Streptomyces sp. NBC_01221]MCX4793046.1 acyl-CoA/acyl-ACP dehydrogenase [Streptomyces sp. NBC_01242]WSP60942.1 acyl-CoA/acyl-ACP dehydrogenase [Streptomyces sp. NBC_01240]